MYILHIETSTAVCSVALSQDNTLIGLKETTEGMNHSALLAPFIEQLLESAGIRPVDLGAVSVSSGPGSYTGLRVGGSTAKAMAYSLGIPLVAVPTLEALALAIFEKHPEATHALPMIDARRKEVYTALYDRNLLEIWPLASVILNEAFYQPMAGFSGYIYSGGDGSLKISEAEAKSAKIRVNGLITCSARHLISPSMGRLADGKMEDPMHFVPNYLKPPNITVPKKTG